MTENELRELLLVIMLEKRSLEKTTSETIVKLMNEAQKNKQLKNEEYERCIRLESANSALVTRLKILQKTNKRLEALILQMTGCALRNR